MGIYLIAAGRASNREKTLDRSYSVDELCKFLSKENCNELKQYFLEGKDVFLWGANEKHYTSLNKMTPREYAVDIKNEEVVQVFRFCFFIDTNDTRLQEYVEWDNKRPYRYVFFLAEPQKTRVYYKEYFQHAFGYKTRNWLAGQRYFNDGKVRSAIRKTNTINEEDFLGIDSDSDIGSM